MPLIYISLSFIVLYMIVDLFGHLDEIIREQVGISLLLKYYLNFFPIILLQILPFACLVAILYSLGNLQKYNEIIAMYASGIGLWRIIKPYVSTGLVLSIFAFILNERVIPHAFSKARNIREGFKNKRQEQHKGIMHNVTLYGQGNRIIYSRSFDLEKKILYDLIILEHDKNQTLVSRTTAKLAVWQNQSWRLYGIVIYHLDPEGRFVGEPEYVEEKEVYLTDKPDDFIQQDFIVEAMNSKELHGYISKFRGGSEKITRRLYVEFHYKKSSPFGPLVMTIIAIPFALVQNTAGRLMSLGMSFGTGILFYGLNAVSLGLGKTGVLPPLVSAWISPLIFVLAGIILLKRNPR
jgi:lipopolysaccharide export system permease protein